MFESRIFFEEWYAFRHCWWRFVYGTEDSPRNNTIGSSKAYRGSWFFEENGGLLSEHISCLSYIIDYSGIGYNSWKKFIEVETD